MADIRFGTGGWRAVIGEDFTRDNIRRVGQGVFELMKEEGHTERPVVIGYDRRFLSDRASVWLAEVLCANGVKVLYMKRSAPTPLVMYTVKEEELFYGLEVTASHNPPEYNGVKLIVEEGRDAPVERTQRLEELIEQVGEPAYIPFEKAVGDGLAVCLKNPFNGFIDSIISNLDMNVIREHGPRILFDPMHGSGTYPLMAILYTARCTVDLMNYNKDAYFGGSMPAPGKSRLYDLRDRVIAGGYELGIATDGDGDRLGIIDSNGEYIDANQILAMLYCYLHEYRGWKGPVVRNLATTHMLDRMADDYGEKCYEVPVGFKYISAKLDEVDAVLGGESSGGLTVRGHIFGKDSIYAAALFVEMMSAIGKSPSEFWEELTEKYGNHVMAEDNLVFRPEDKESIDRTVMVEKRIPDFGKPIEKVGYEDGCKVYFTDGSFVICRFSGTEPLLRIFAEARDEASARELIGRFKSFLSI